MAGRLVERAGRLVGEDDGRVHAQCAGDGDALHLAAAHLAGALCHQRAQSEALEPQHGLRCGLRVRHAAQHERQRDVFHRGQFGQQLARLEDEAERVAAQCGALGVGHGGEVGAAELHGAGGGRDDAGERVQQRGLAGAGGAHHSHGLAGVQREVDAVERERVRGECALVLRSARCGGLRGVVHRKVGGGEDRLCCGVHASDCMSRRAARVSCAGMNACAGSSSRTREGQSSFQLVRCSSQGPYCAMAALCACEP